jgi:hypothetical protein
VLSLEVQLGERNPNFTGRMSLDRNFLFQTGPSGSIFIIFFFNFETLFSKLCGLHRPSPTDMITKSRITAHLIFSKTLFCVSLDFCPVCCISVLQ